MISQVWLARLPGLMRYIKYDLEGYEIQKRHGLPTQTFHHHFLSSKDSKLIKKKSLELIQRILNGEDVNLYQYKVDLESYVWEHAVMAYDCYYYDERLIDIGSKNEVFFVIHEVLKALGLLNKEVLNESKTQERAYS